MTIFYNGTPLQLPEGISTLSDLAAYKKIPAQGTAIAVNDKLVKRSRWDVKKLQDNDSVTVIGAAFGG